MTPPMSLWQDNSTPQMCHPHHQKGWFQLHTLSTKGLQGHPQKCPPLVKGMRGALDPTFLSQSSSVSLGCFLGVGICRIVSRPHASGHKEPILQPYTHGSGVAEGPQECPPALHLGSHSPHGHPWAQGSPQGCPGAVPRPTAPLSTTGQDGVPELSPAPAEGGSPGPEPLQSGVPWAVPSSITRQSRVPRAALGLSPGTHPLQSRVARAIPRPTAPAEPGEGAVPNPRAPAEGLSPAQGCRHPSRGFPRAAHNTATTAQHRPPPRTPGLSWGCPQPPQPQPSSVPRPSPLSTGGRCPQPPPCSRSYLLDGEGDVLQDSVLHLRRLHGASARRRRRPPRPPGAGRAPSRPPGPLRPAGSVLPAAPAGPGLAAPRRSARHGRARGRAGPAGAQRSRAALGPRSAGN